MIRKYALLAGSILMGLSFFMPWVTQGSTFSGYNLADMYSKMHDNHLFLRFASVPKVTLGILVLYFGKAPKNFVYYVVPVLSLIPLIALDGSIFDYQSIHYGFYVLHLAVLLIWIGAFSYKYQSETLVKRTAK